MILRKVTVVSLIGIISLSACATEEQQARAAANAERNAASKSVTLSACYSASETEVANAQRIIDTQGGADGGYWLWRPSWKEGTLAKVNALETVELNSNCLQRIEASCSSLGLEPASGFVSRALAAAGRGELEIKCSPRLEQS